MYGAVTQEGWRHERGFVSYEAVMHHDPELLEREDAVAVEIEPADHGPALVQGQLLLLRAQQPAEHPLQARWRDVLPSRAGGLRRVVRVHPERRPRVPPPAVRVVAVGLAGQPKELAAVQQAVPVGVRRRDGGRARPPPRRERPPCSRAARTRILCRRRPCPGHRTTTPPQPQPLATNDRVLRRLLLVYRARSWTGR
jgi:hypothetical protein